MDKSNSHARVGCRTAHSWPILYVLPALAASAASLFTLASEAVAADLRRSDVDASLVFSSAPDPSAFPNDGQPWISQATPIESAPAPIAVNPNDTGVAVRASLGQMRDYNAQTTAKKIDAAKAFAPNAAPKVGPPPAPVAPVDVWSSYEVQGLDGDADKTRRAGVGAEYKVSPYTTVGIMAEHGEARSDAGAEQDEKLAAFVAFRLAPAVTVDARTEWQDATSSAAGGRVETNTISLAPRVGKAFALDGGATVEPFVTYKHAFEVESTGGAGVDSSAAGAGVTYAKPDAYSLSVTTDIESAGASEPANLNSRLQLKLPIR